MSEFFEDPRLAKAFIEIGRFCGHCNLVLDKFEPQLHALPKLLKELAIYEVQPYAKDAMRLFMDADTFDEALRGVTALLAAEQKHRDDQKAQAEMDRREFKESQQN